MKFNFKVAFISVLYVALITSILFAIICLLGLEWVGFGISLFIVFASVFVISGLTCTDDSNDKDNEWGTNG